MQPHHGSDRHRVWAFWVSRYDSHLLIQCLHIGKNHLVPPFGLSPIPNSMNASSTYRSPRFELTVLVVVHLDHTMVVSQNGDDVKATVVASLGVCHRKARE